MDNDIVIIRKKKKNNSGGLGLIIVIVAIWGIFSWLISLLEQWRDLPTPYNLITGFYYYTIIGPWYFFKYIWYTIKENTLIPYSNLNLALACFAILISGLLIFKLITFIFDKLDDYGISSGLVFMAYLSPAFLALIIYIFNWLILK